MLGSGPDEARPEPAARKPKAKPAKAQRQAAPDGGPGPRPGARTSGQDDSLLIE